MLAIERRNKILSLLQTDKKVVVSELSESFRVSEETIRRDLERMEKEGYCTKTYGGAIIKEDSAVELPFTVRKNTNVAGKQQIAKLIAIMIRDGDQIMLDASSTAVFVAQNIKKKKNITVITNSIEVLFELSDVTGWK
ncbi:MAG: DeoR/GlpR transcriptional regulator, partial [Parasporobacterium sp.]|nr:DeoR/GlpR transcriptional regulator [Parasporobacterium sp.]